MPMGKFFIERSLWGHSMIHPARQIAYFGVQRAAHRDRHLLKAPTNAKNWLARGNTGPNERQHQSIPRPIKTAMRGGFGMAIFFRVNIGPASSE